MINNQEVPQGYKKTKVGVIPEEWEIPSVDTILNRIRKKVEVQKDVNYQQIGIRSHAKGIFHKKSVTGKQLGNKSVFWIEEDCFIVNIVFAWEQSISKTTTNEIGMIASHRFPMYKAKDNKVDIDYILYFFKTPRGKHLLGLASPGGAGRNKTLGQSNFYELQIPLPPLKEQQKIAEILTTWDSAISIAENLIKEKEELKIGLMQKLLSGEVRFSGFSREWENATIDELFTFKKGQGLSKDKILNEGVNKCILYGELYTTYNEVISKIKSKTNSNEGIKSIEDDILIPASTTTSAIDLAIASVVKFKDILLGGDINILRKKSNVTDGEFMANYLTHIKKIELAKYAQGITIIHLYSKDFKNLKIKLPLLKEQQKIAEVLSNADKEIDLLKNELKELKEQKKGLMQKLLTGKVRVKT
jgi:type I restriction enzyme S subunit